MKVLIIDNNLQPDSWGSPDIRKFVQQTSGTIIYTRRGPHGDLPGSPKAFDKIIVSGSKNSAMDSSPWVLSLLDFIRAALNGNKPFLGVCYGHQMLARALTGDASVGKSALGEIGWTKISVTDDSKLFDGLPKEFYSLSSHFEEVKKVPEGFRRLAQSESCGIQAMQLGHQPVFGIQFHPERNLEQGEERYVKAKKEKSDPRFVLNAGKGAQLFDPKVGEKIFGNFLAGA